MKSTAMSWQLGQPLCLETSRFFVRSMTPADVTNQFIAWTRDPEVIQTLNLPVRKVKREEFVRYVQRFDNKVSFGLGIFTKKEDHHIGFYSVLCDNRQATAITNVVIGERDYWGKGVVIETRAAILDFLFDRLAIHKVWGKPFARNFPAVFNYKAQGFTCEGVLREHLKSVTGGRIDQLVFGLLRHEWRARKTSPHR